ncbi:MAG: glycosyltransferase family 4 protein, partial [Planctomycetales bacterium]
MKPLRLVLITRRYWPLVGGAETAMANLARELSTQGHEVFLLTARWESEWPEEIRHAGARVIRLAQPRQRFWGTWRYMQGIRRWLANNRDDFDVVYASMLKHDAYAALGVGAKLGFPVIARAEGAGATGDAHWQQKNPFGSQIRRRCREARAIVAPSQEIERELLQAGYEESQVVRISNGTPTLDELPS